MGSTSIRTDWNVWSMIADQDPVKRMIGITSQSAPASVRAVFETASNREVEGNFEQVKAYISRVEAAPNAQLAALELLPALYDGLDFINERVVALRKGWPLEPSHPHAWASSHFIAEQVVNKHVKLARYHHR